MTDKPSLRQTKKSLTQLLSHYTIESSFENIELAFDLVRVSMNKPVGLKTEWDAVRHYLFDVWKMKLHKQLTPFAGDDVFDELFRNAIKIHQIHCELQGCSCEGVLIDVIRMSKVRRVFSTLITEIYDVGRFDPFDC